MTDHQRVEWVDIAKTFAIILVAIYHSAVIGVPMGLANPIWTKINWGLEAFRMPVFFFASGLFAASVIRRPWRLLWSSRLALLAWTFLLWTVVRFSYFLVVPMPTRPSETDVAALIAAAVWPTTGLWFLHALLVFFALSKVIEPIPTWIKFSVAAVLSALFFSGFSTGNLSYNGMARYYLFFLCGVHCKTMVLRLNGQPQRLLTVVAFLLLAVAMLLLWKTGLSNAFGAKTLLSGLAVVSGCLLARLIAGTGASRWMAYIGRNTLPVYVLHVIMIAFISSVADHLLSPGSKAVFGVLYPILTALIVVPVALAIGSWAAKSGARYLFEPPGWFARPPVMPQVRGAVPGP